ncbi:hypothetical protein ROG8370_03515 [Roseovarius gaetbuli]|uniref:Methyltransferase FkbM domain-containing protein n=1 Tax=Roseovarius gaetbuli TaxID=1356575 RepID=A0A1X7A9V7_9RHOB|nr:hypothetical protein [Roseovarius gaetbuli]SLN72477.1 hypothetical protein ROG8370_03515 [Roseovarius gaetbuli]
MTKTLGSIVYLGSGLCSDLDTYLASNPARIYLVEPNPGLVDDLAQLCHAHATVEHLACGVTVAGGRQRLDVYNFFDLSSFSEPHDLLDVYPGAVVETAHQVQTLTPAGLMDRLNLPEAAPHRLVLETSGIEHALLEAFINSGTLGAFADLSVRIPAHALFKGSRDIAQIDALLEAAGYRQTPLAATSGNADFQLHHYKFDPQAYRLIGIEEENAVIEAQRKNAADKAEALEAQNAALTTELDQARAEAEAQRKDAADKAEALEAQNAALTTERDQAREDAEAAEAQRKDAADKAEALEVQNAALTTERDQTLEKSTKEQAAVIELEKQERVMALRVQTRLQSSHLELQERFEALQTKYTTQRTLIAALIKKLEVIVPAPKPAIKKAPPSKARTRKTGATGK